LRLRRRLDSRLSLIAVLAAIAPLLGLLGTVLGMIETFDVIAMFGTGNARAMAGGISVALITTQTGLLVAIPGLLMSNRLGRISSNLKTSLDETVAGLTRRIAEGGTL
jgi:biopolymer transport protein ExbB